MINKLLIENYQSHKESELEFHPGVNIIIGTSDSGKTAILRALKWPIINKPAGDGFRRHGTKETNVQLTTNDEDLIRVSRVKSKSNNEYLLTIDEDTESFKAFGQGVPEEIIKVLNMLPLNIQSQMDPPFLLHESSTPGKVAEAFSSAVNLDVIGRAQTNINKTLSDTKQEIGTGKADKERYETDLIQYEHLPALEKKIEKLEKIDAELTTITGNETILEGLVKSHEVISSDIARTSTFLKIEGKVSNLDEKVAYNSNAARKIGELRGIVKEIETNEGQISKYRVFVRYEREVLKLIVQSRERDDQYENIGSLNYLMDQIKQTEISIKSEGDELDSLQSEFDEMMPDECPLCGRGD